MTDATPDALEILLTLYRENSQQARHYERQRQSIAGTVSLVAAIVLGFLACRPADVRLYRNDGLLLSACLLVVAGGVGFVTSLTRHERGRLHVERVHAVRRELSRRFPVDIQALYDAASKVHARRYPRLSELTGRAHYAWQALHVAIAALGLALLWLVAFRPEA